MKLLLRLAVMGTLWGTVVSAATPVDDNHSEQAVKAAFVMRFASYVEWPPDVDHPPRLHIAVLGASDVAVQLQRLVANRAFAPRTVQVRRIARIDDVGDAQILYVGTDRREELRALVAKLVERSILVISSEDDALASGSTINLLTVDNRVRFEVSLASARRARLKISSELLSLAVRVQK